MKKIDQIIIEARPTGFRVAFYANAEGDEPTSIGACNDAEDVLEMIARDLGVPCPEWLPKLMKDEAKEQRRVALRLIVQRVLRTAHVFGRDGDVEPGEHEVEAVVAEIEKAGRT